MSGRWASKRLKEMEPSPFRSVAARLLGMKDVIKLSSGDPDFATPPHIIEAAHRALSEGATHYTPTSGLPRLKEAISEYYRKFDLNVDPNAEVIVTPGSQQALYLTLASVLGPGDEVLISDPSYTVYEPTIKFLGARPVRFPLDRENNFHPDLDAMEAKVSDRTKMILICTPNNPTGTVLSKTDLEAVAQVAREHDLLVVSDEIYSEFIWGDGRHLSIAALPGMKERTVVIVSFSKTFAMTGWRLGYLIADGALVKQMLKLQGNMVLCPAAFVQMAGVAALTGPWEPVKAMRREYEDRVNFLAGRLDEIDGVSCPKPEGAFYLFPDISQVCTSSRKFCDGLLEERKLAATAGVHFGPLGEGHIRLALVRPVDVLSEAADRIESHVKESRTR